MAEQAPQEQILDSIMDHIGNTPMVRLNRIPQADGVPEGVEVLAKAEFFNAAGSVKDRIGKRMVEDAERTGRIKPGDTLIEPTSGNTGLGLALAAAVKGYRAIITLPEKMSAEKVCVLKALGAEIVRTPTEAAFDSPESHIGVANRLNGELPNSHILDQYSNPSNPDAHYYGTGQEIWDQCGGRVDVVVMGAGTGGTISGVARRLKELNPEIQIVGVDPKGSILAVPENLNDEKRLQSYVVEGIGYDFIPDVLDRSLVDQWIKTDDSESFIMARRLIRDEGLLAGGSSGSAMVAAMQVARTLPAGKRVVVLLPDSVRNYLSKFVSDEWMIKQGYIDNDIVRRPEYRTWWSSRQVSDLGVPAPISISPDVSCREAVRILKEQGFDMVPVIGEDNTAQGVVTEANLTAKLVSGRVQPGDACSSVMYRQFCTVLLTSPLSELASLFDMEHYALVMTEQRNFTAAGEETRRTVAGVVTRIDLLNYISQGEDNGEGGADATSPAEPTA